MSTTPSAETPVKPTLLPSRMSILASAMLGAFIGGLVCLQAYHSVLGGADQQQRLAQIEKTVEHSRQVSEQALALLTKIEGDQAERVAQSNHPLSKKPTQRELSEAIDGLLSDAAPEDQHSAEDYKRIAKVDLPATQAGTGDRQLQALAELTKPDQPDQLAISKTVASVQLSKEANAALAEMAQQWPTKVLSDDAKKALAQVAEAQVGKPEPTKMDNSLKEALNKVALAVEKNSPEAIVKADSDRRLLAQSKAEGAPVKAEAASKVEADK